MTYSIQRPNNAFNRSVYFGQGKCDFVPNCAFETFLHFEKLPNGGVIRIFQSDNKQYTRAVYFPNGQVITGCAGLLFNTKTKEVIWSEVNPANRGQGIYKQLKAFTQATLDVRLWSQFQSSDLLKAAHIGE